MNARERVWKAFEFEEPDRVPIFELGIDLLHMEAIAAKTYGGRVLVVGSSLGKSGEEELVELTVECYKKLGFDMILYGVSAPKGWKPETRTDGTIIDEWGRILYYDSKCRSWSPGGKTIFETPEQWENFELPDPHAPGRTEALEHMKHLVRGEMVLAGTIRDPFSSLWEMFAPINFVKWMYGDPQFIRRMFEKMTAYNVEIIKILADSEVELIISSGDWCEKNGPMVPLKFFRDVIYPNLRIQVDVAHSRGLKFIKHTDGNIMPLLEDSSRIVDGFHSLDPSAGVDIGEVKKKYGDRLILFGNVSVDNLARKSKEAITDEVKECIRKASPGGGHILSSSNTWFTDARLENCLTMVEVGKRFGIYPISF